MATADFSRIASNIGALNALNSLNNINQKLGVHQQRLATGKRINSAADDPAGLTIATKLNARSEGLKVASDNIADAQNLLSVAESGLGRINDIMVQMRNKAEQAASDTLGDEEREAIVTQLSAYAEQIDDLVDQTTWNGTKLIDGDFTATFQTGSQKADTTDYDASQAVDVDELGIGEKVTSETWSTLATDTRVKGIDVSGATTDNLGAGAYAVKVEYGSDSTDVTVSLVDAGGTAIETSTGVDISSGDVAVGLGDITATIAQFTSDDAGVTHTGGELVGFAEGDYKLTTTDADGDAVTLTGFSDGSDFAQYMEDLDSAMGVVSKELSKVGALMGRLSFKAEQVTTAQVNVEASYNRIMNADMATEQLEATKFSILQQTATTMLAQANTGSQNILSLFR
jgi:flagellin